MNKDYQTAAEITKDTAGNYDYKFLCDLHRGFRSEIMCMSDKQIVNRLGVKENYANSLQHYAYESFAKERIRQLNKKEPKTKLQQIQSLKWLERDIKQVLM